MKNIVMRFLEWPVTFWVSMSLGAGLIVSMCSSLVENRYWFCKEPWRIRGTVTGIVIQTAILTVALLTRAIERRKEKERQPPAGLTRALAPCLPCARADACSRAH